MLYVTHCIHQPSRVMKAINQHHGQRHKPGPGKTVAEAAFSTRRERTVTIFNIRTVKKALAVLATKLSCSGCYITTPLAVICGACVSGCILSIMVSEETHPTVCEEGGQKREIRRWQDEGREAR